MFHRPRSGLHVHPVMPTAENPSMTETRADESTPTPPYQPQPVVEEEAEPMSMYNNTNQTPAEPQNEAVTSNNAPQNAAPSAYAPQQPTIRPAMPAMGQRSPYGYGQAYVGGTTEATVSTGRKLVIGEGITLSGEIEACDHLVVEGTVEASLKGASVLDVSQSGMFFGAVEINEATIAGRFEGDLVVNGRLTVRATGTITGTIAYKELAVEAGATIDGKINPMSVNRMTTSEKKPQGQQQNKGMKAQGDAANELPFSGNKAAAAA